MEGEAWFRCQHRPGMVASGSWTVALRISVLTCPVPEILVFIILSSELIEGGKVVCEVGLSFGTYLDARAR